MLHSPARGGGGGATNRSRMGHRHRNVYSPFRNVSYLVWLIVVHICNQAWRTRSGGGGSRWVNTGKVIKNLCTFYERPKVRVSWPPSPQPVEISTHACKLCSMTSAVWRLVLWCLDVPLVAWRCPAVDCLVCVGNCVVTAHIRIAE